MSHQVVSSRQPVVYPRSTALKADICTPDVYGGGENVVWSGLANDPVGIALFLIWLLLPPLYVVVLGRKYAQQCADSAQAAMWSHERLQQALEDLEASSSKYAQKYAPSQVPIPRPPRSDTDSEITVPIPTGRHRRPDRPTFLAHTGS